IGGNAVFAIVAAHQILAALGGRDGLHGVVGDLDDALLGNQVGRGEGAVAVALGSDFLDGLDVVVLIAPEIDDGLVVVGRGVGGGRRAFGGWRCTVKEDARTVLGECDGAALADDEFLAEAGGGGGREKGGLGRLAVPAVEREAGRLGGLVVAIGE